MLTKADLDMFKIGDPVLVLYPKEDKKYHGAYSAFYVKTYTDGKKCLVLWADGKFRHTTTVVHRRYIKMDDGRPAMEESHLRQYVNTRDRITQTLSSEAYASESEEEVRDSDSSGNSEKYTPSKRPKRQAFNRARRKIRRTVNKLTHKMLKKEEVGQSTKTKVVNVKGQMLGSKSKSGTAKSKPSVCEIWGRNCRKPV